MKRLIVLVVAIALAMVFAVPAGAAPASTTTVTDFLTGGVDANGDIKLVFCDQAHQQMKGDIVRETYSCEFEGGAVLPTSAMRWDKANTGLRWFSDVEDITSGFDLCWLYTDDWSMVITPSGKVNVTVVYDPDDSAVWEGPEC